MVEAQIRVGIVGLGLIGGSIGLGLRASGRAHVVGYDVDPTTLDVAVARGAIDAPLNGLAGLAEAADLIVLACPPPANLEILEKLKPILPESCTVTDTGSVKGEIARLGARLFGGAFVPGHPMAGSESSGIGEARPDLFQGAPWILSAAQGSQSLQVASVVYLIHALGARPTFMSAEAHDRFAAAVSHVPHLLSFACLGAVTASAKSSDYLALAGPGFRDFTRLARSNPRLWAQILTSNREAVLAELEAVSALIATMREAIDRDDTEKVEQLLTQRLPS